MTSFGGLLGKIHLHRDRVGFTGELHIEGGGLTPAPPDRLRRGYGGAISAIFRAILHLGSRVSRRHVSQTVGLPI